MISRAVRVPRICQACRFGLIQRSAKLSLRPVFLEERLVQRRYYVSDGDKNDQNKADPFSILKSTSSNINAQSTKHSTENETISSEPRQPITDEETLSTKNSNTTSGESPAIVGETQEPSEPSEVRDQDRPSTEPPSKRTDLKVTASFEPPTTFVTQQEAESFSDDFSREKLEPVTSKDGSLFLEDESIFGIPQSSKPSQPSNSGPKHDFARTKENKHTRHRANLGPFELPEYIESKPEEEEEKIPYNPYHRLVHDEPLGVSALGMPAEAIVINNPNQLRPSHPKPVEVAEKPLPLFTQEDWDYNSKARQDLTLEELFANIDEMRPSSQVMRAADINKLVEALCDGFTTEQMRSYIRLHDVPDYEKVMVTYPWVVKHIPWVANKTVAQHYSSSKASCAQRLVLSKWKIQVQEHAVDIGRSYVWIDPEFFPFLTRKSLRYEHDLNIKCFEIAC